MHSQALFNYFTTLFAEMSTSEESDCERDVTEVVSGSSDLTSTTDVTTVAGTAGGDGTSPPCQESAEAGP